MVELKNSIETLNKNLEIVSLNNIDKLKTIKAEAEFNLKNIDKSLVNKYYKKAGIYYFEIKFIKDLNNGDIYKYLYDEWRIDSRKNIPNIIKKRVEKYSMIKKDNWYPFYIGKSGNVGERLGEHLEGTSTTASLRLNEINNGIFKIAEYRIKVIDLDDLKGEYYWTVGKIESNMREILNPICGK